MVRAAMDGGSKHVEFCWPRAIARGQMLSVIKLRFASISLFLCITACSSQHNVVRLKRSAKQHPSVFTLSTEHYLHADDNHVAELDRGERTLTVNFRKEIAANSAQNETISVAVKLYHDDPPFSGKLRIRLDNEDFDFVAENLTKEIFAEAVTVLDTGQRQEDNANLSNSAQAQTGYITFGKPVASGSSKRRWKIHRFNILANERFFAAAQNMQRLEISTRFGNLPAVTDVSDKQIAAWKRYVTNIVDQETDP